MKDNLMLGGKEGRGDKKHTLSHISDCFMFFTWVWGCFTKRRVQTTD